ncbi:MAG: glycosyltransferase [Acidobacteriaceae bacterium]|nr:glycosyltransferase [Acidobacteriaceae bacterium]MBV9501127.1 glycosyltransferase [Acidobacteriaceae bacterium]
MIENPSASSIISPERRVCVIIPCYNEGSRLDVEQFSTWISCSRDTHLLFIDDGSTDNTLLVLKELRARYRDRITILSCRPNRGKAEAVRAGVLHAIDDFKPAVVGYWDADLATPLDSIDRFLEVLAARFETEMVFGSRIKLLGRYVERRPIRHYLGRVFATVVSTLLHLAIYDTQCGAKLFRVNRYTREVFGEPFLSKWVFDVEIIARYLNIYGGDPQRLEEKIYEYPLETWVDIAGSKVRPTDFFLAFWDVVRIRQHYLSPMKTRAQTRQ